MHLDWDIVTPHYPPQKGGIADYTFIVARALALHGDSVSVWCPRAFGDTAQTPNVRVNRVFQTFSPKELVWMERIWAATGKRKRRILLMYHPHGFRSRSLNVLFCLWLWRRVALHGDRLVLVLHEFAIDFKPWKYYLFAAVHRLMLALALRGAAQVWSPVEGWIKSVHKCALGRRVPVEWLPVFSNIPLAGDAAEVLRARRNYVKEGELLIGHFGSCPSSVTRILDGLLPGLLRSRENLIVLLIGDRTDQYAKALQEAQPHLAGKIRGTGSVSASSVSINLRSCDILLQPYADGVNARRGSAIAALANGVPMITTAGRLTDPCWNELAGIRLVPVTDLAKIIAVTEELVDDPDLRRSMSVSARSYYEQHFTPEQVVRRLRACELALLQDAS